MPGEFKLDILLEIGSKFWKTSEPKVFKNFILLNFFQSFQATNVELLEFE